MNIVCLFVCFLEKKSLAFLILHIFKTNDDSILADLDSCKNISSAYLILNKNFKVKLRIFSWVLFTRLKTYKTKENICIILPY